MLNKIIKTVCIIVIFVFTYFIVSLYLSDKNIEKIQSNRINIKDTFNDKYSGLPKLENDTDEIIVYFSETITDKKIKKRKIWELLRKNE